MPGIPSPFTDPSGQDIVEQEQAALIRYQGEGLFSADPESAHGQLLAVLGTGLAFARSVVYRILADANPTTAVETLDQWEDAFAIPRAPDSWDTTRRQQRLANHTRLEYGASLAQLEALFTEICRHPVTGVTGFSWVCADADAVAAGLHIFDWVVVLTDDCWGNTGAWAGYSFDTVWACNYTIQRVGPAHMQGMLSYETLYPPPP
jgi:hypothetical protein